MADAEAARTEPEGVAARPVLLIAVGFLAFVGVCLAAVFFYFNGEIGRRRLLQPKAFPAPQLQRAPLLDLDALQKAQRRQLAGYAWVDKDHGIVRVPIERAMQILASKGAAAFGPLDDINKPPAPATPKAPKDKAAQNAAKPEGARK